MSCDHHVQGNLELGKVQKNVEVKKQPKDEASSMHTDNSTSLVTAENGTSASAVLVALCLGDFMHNFTDGVFIGAAFKLCSPDVAWGIIWGTCAHEVRESIVLKSKLVFQQTCLSECSHFASFPPIFH